MTQKRTLGSSSLKVRVKDDKVTITFNAQNWGATQTELLKTIALHAVYQNVPVADHIGNALKLQLRDISPSQESFDLNMRLCEKLAAAEQTTQQSPDDHPHIGGPK